MAGTFVIPWQLRG